MNLFKILIITAIILVYGSFAHAQDDGDDFFDDDEYDAPVEDKSRGARPGDTGIPPPRVTPRFGQMPTQSTPPQVNQYNPSPTKSSNSFGDNSTEVHFQLVDPPKFWKPKKKRFHPPLRTDE